MLFVKMSLEAVFYVLKILYSSETLPRMNCLESEVKYESIEWVLCFTVKFMNQMFNSPLCFNILKPLNFRLNIRIGFNGNLITG